MVQRAASQEESWDAPMPLGYYYMYITMAILLWQCLDLKHQNMYVTMATHGVTMVV